MKRILFVASLLFMSLSLSISCKSKEQPSDSEEDVEDFDSEDFGDMEEDTFDTMDDLSAFSEPTETIQPTTIEESQTLSEPVAPAHKEPAVQTPTNVVEEKLPEMPNTPKPKSTIVNADGKGKYPETSQRRLTEEELKNYSSSDLKIMRNEIFARHGYIFNTKSLRDYFSAHSWYTPVNADVTNQLTDVENFNIRLIKRLEN